MPDIVRREQRIVAAEVVKDEELATPLDGVEALRQFQDQMKDRAFLLMPLAALDEIPPIYTISRRVVAINPAVTMAPNGYSGVGEDCYFLKQFHRPGEVSLGKTGLMKLMAAAGLSALPTVRMDDRSDPNYCEMQAGVSGRDFDGTQRTMTNTKAIDLRDGAPDAKGMQANQLDQARRHILRVCETKALEGAIRSWLALQQKYRAEDLATKPFIAFKLVLNHAHPDVRNAAIAENLSPGAAGRLLYGEATHGPLAERQVQAGTKAPPAQASLPAAAASASPGQGARPAAKDAPAPAVEAFDADDFDVPEEEAGEEPALILCLCPCGHQLEITEASAQASAKWAGSPRCAQCFPGKRFEYQAHKDLRDMGYPSHPGMDAAAALARSGK